MIYEFEKERVERTLQDHIHLFREEALKKFIVLKMKLATMFLFINIMMC